MTRHVVIERPGCFLGIRGGLLVVRDGDEVARELPLSRLGSITVAKNGVALSSDLVHAAAARGIRVFFVDFRGAVVAALAGSEQHATVAVRRRQLGLDETARSAISRALVVGKVSNQRAVLRYFAKYHEREEGGPLRAAAARLAAIRAALRDPAEASQDWRPPLLGREGEAAAAYFTALRGAGLLPASFESREGRGSREVANAALNLGYAILQARTWTALLNAGLECYAGILHEDRPGRPALVLDAMEEHRPWVVDRAVVALRAALEADPGFGPAVRRRVIEAVHESLERRIPHRGRKLRVETVIQRQAYRLAGAISGGPAYRAVRYPW